MRSPSALRIVLLVLLFLGAWPRVVSAKSAAQRTGRLEVQLIVVAWPASDSGVTVFVQDVEHRGKPSRARSDRHGVAVFVSLRPGYYLLTAPEGTPDTSSALVVLGDTNRVVLHTRQRGHVPSVFK